MAKPDTHFGNNAIRIASGITKISNNDDVNCSQFAVDGIQTMDGTGRIIRRVRVTAPSWSPGSSAPTAGFVGIFPVLKFDAGHDDNVHYSLIVPYRFAAGSVVNVNVDWCYEGVQDNGTVCWVLDYINVATGEVIDGGTTEINKTTPGTHTTGTLVRTTLDTGIVGAVAHDDLGLLLYRDFSEDTLTADACLIQVHFQFIMDKLGEPT